MTSLEMLHDVNFMEKPMPLIAKVVPLLHYFKNLCHRLVADAEVLQKDIFLEQKIYFEKGVYYAARLYRFSLKNCNVDARLARFPRF